MKKVLCVEDGCGFKAGNIYKAKESIINAGVIRVYQSSNDFSSFNESDPAFKEVKAFERGGEEWIRHNFHFCIPEHWVIEARFTGPITGECKVWSGRVGDWCLGDFEKIEWFRVVSTEPEENPALKDEAHAFSPQQFGALPDSDLGRERKRLLRQSHSLFSELVWVEGEIEGFRKFTLDDAMKDRDERPPSPQELAFAAKHPEPETPKPLAFPDVKLNDNFSCHIGGKWG